MNKIPLNNKIFSKKKTHFSSPLLTIHLKKFFY